MPTTLPQSFLARWGTFARLGGFCVLAVLYVAWAVCDSLTDLGGDSAMYMLMARTLSPFLTHDPIFTEAAAGATFPPLFPLLIGLLGGSFTAAHVLVVASLLLALVFFYHWLRTLQFAAGLAASAALLFALLPGTYLLALKIWSENTYLGLSLLTLWAANRARTDNAARAQRWWWTALMAASAAVMTRSAGLPLLLAMAVEIVRTRPRRWPWMVVALTAPLLVWTIWSRLHASGVSSYAQQLSILYGTDALEHLRAQLTTEIPVLLRAWFAMWLNGPAPPPLTVTVGVFGTLVLLGCMVRIFQIRPDAIYAVLYLAMLSIWPWPDEASRLLYPILPVLVAQGLFVCDRILAKLGRPRLSFAVIAVLAVAVLPSLAISAHRRLRDIPDPLRLLRYIPSYYSAQTEDAALVTARLINDFPRWAPLVAPGECIFTVKPALSVLLAAHKGVLPPPLSSSDREFHDQLQECRYAYLTVVQSPAYPEPFYPRSRLADGYRPLWILPDATLQEGILAELVELKRKTGGD